MILVSSSTKLFWLFLKIAGQNTIPVTLYYVNIVRLEAPKERQDRYTTGLRPLVSPTRNILTEFS
jgi:sRNA-binding regulator protein Hfq